MLFVSYFNVEIMSESEIIIPVSSINRKSSVSASSTVSGAKTNKMVEVSLSKFIKLLSNHDLNSISEKYSDSKLSLSADLLLDLASMQEDVQFESPKVSFLVVGMLGAVLLSFLILLIFLV